MNSLNIYKYILTIILNKTNVKVFMLKKIIKQIKQTLILKKEIDCV